MAKYDLRLKARKMRMDGASILDITRSLQVSKGSVSLWCRDFKLNDQQIVFLKERAIAAGHKGRMIGAEINRQKKLTQLIARPMLRSQKLVSVMIGIC